MALLCPIGPQFFKNDGTVAAGCKLYTRITGTTTQKTAWQDQAGLVAHDYPIDLDSSGYPDTASGLIWLTAGDEYRIRLEDAAGALIWQEDDIYGVADSSSANTSVADSENYFSGTSVETVLAEIMLKRYAVNPLEARFGAVGDNSADDEAALNAAAAYATTNGRLLYIPPLTYRIADTVIFENCHVHADGAEFRPDATVTYGVDVGSASTICDSKVIRGLKVRGVGWTSHPSGAAAWRFLNATNCTFDNIGGNRMEKGARVQPPTGARVAYCEWRNPYFHRCSRNFDIYVDGTGFAAGNTVWGGRFQLSSTETAEAHVYAEKTSGSGSMNDWQWVNCRMESYAGATVPRWAMRLLRADFWRITDPRTEGDWADADFEFSANSTDCVVEMLYDNNITVIDGNGTNVVRYQRTEGLGAMDQTDPAASCVRRFYANGTSRIQVLSDGTALPGLSLGSIASENAVEVVWIPTSSSIAMRVGGTAISETTATAHRPLTDGTISSGSSGRKWSDVWSVNAANNTSDERLKEQVSAIPDEWLDAWADVEFLRFKWKSAVASKGDAARWHISIMAQRLVQAFAARGLDAFQIGVVGYDEWAEEPEVRAKDGSLVQPYRAAGSAYNIRADECQFLELALMRRELKRLKESQ